MKKTSILIVLISLAICAYATNTLNKYNIVCQTNSVCINGNCFPLNNLVLKVFPDSINVQFFTTSGFGDGYDFAPVTQKDSAVHYFNNGVKLNSVSSVDSLFIAKFVK